MSTVKVLSEIKDFLKEKVTPNIKLRLPDDNDTTLYTLVEPNTFVGWVPPKGYLPEGMEYNIPCIVVGLDDAEDNNEKSSYGIRLTFAVYSQMFSRNKFDTNADNVYTNFDGYAELLNFIDLAKSKLRKDTIINKYIKIDSSIKWGMYAEQPLPYWYGYMTFEVANNAYPAENLESILNNL